MTPRVITVLTFGPYHEKPWWWNHISLDPTRCEIRYVRLSRGSKSEKDLSLPEMLPLGLRIAKLLFGEARKDHYIMTFEAGIPSFIVSLIQTIAFSRTPKHVIIQFIMRERKGTWSSRAKYIFMKACFSSLHMAICSSRREAAYYNNAFQFPTGKFRFVPFHTDPKLLDHPTGPKEDFLFCGGRIFRDYETLIKAVDGTSIPTVIVSSETYRSSVVPPPNVVMLKGIPIDEFNQLLARCRVVILPLEDKEISAGQTVLLHAMALGKAVIATKTSGTMDYIEDGVNGLFVAPHDPEKLRETIRQLITDDEQIARLGANAKKIAREKYLPQHYIERVSALLLPAKS